ncbi:MAG: formylglycine-generating enzyme family protein [Hyphomicrobiales bacterium]|nr:formylglycine-generating enzyme family protein [Hyphomicrobiales bacterium]
MLSALALATLVSACIPLAHAQQVLAPEREAALPPGDSFRECTDCPEMMVVPSGAFTMGSPVSESGRNTWEGPQHVVTIARPFAVGKFEVTVDQFGAFVRETGYNDGSRCWTFESGAFNERAERSWHNPGFAQDGNHPATCLSFDDATAYVNWLQKKTGRSYRLLSEAEWEYAARGQAAPRSGPRFGVGDDEKALCTYANGLDETAREALRDSTHTWTFLPCRDGYVFTAPVGKFAANGFGLHDVLGNVKEWTQDCFHQGKGYEGAPNDGSPWTALSPCPTRITRGGSWLSYGRLLRLAFRYRGSAAEHANDIGLRVARTLRAP